MGLTDGTGWRERGHVEMGERIPARQSWSAAGGHTFRNPQREWALVIRAWGGEGGGNEVESGLPQWVKAAGNSCSRVCPSSTCLPPAGTSAAGIFRPKISKPCSAEGEVGHD